MDFLIMYFQDLRSLQKDRICNHNKYFGCIIVGTNIKAWKQDSRRAVIYVVYKFNYLFAFVEASDPGRYERFVTVGDFGTLDIIDIIPCITTIVSAFGGTAILNDLFKPRVKLGLEKYDNKRR